MKVSRRTNLLWGIVFLGAAVIFLLSALGVLPAGIADIAGRAWPVLLVLIGVSIFLRDRVPFGSLIALAISAALVAGVTAAAFSTRTAQVRSDHQETVDQSISDNVNLLRIEVRTAETDVELVRALDERHISGQFTGSTESDVQVNYIEAVDNTATLTITETHPSQFPMLEAVGRGRLRLELPPNIPLDVNMIGGDGIISLNMGGLAVERLNMNWPVGDALVTLPAYDPQASTEDAVLGALVVGDGDITIFVPPEVAARFELNRGSSGLQPAFDAVLYNYLVGDILEARNFDSAEIKMRYVVTAPRGLITITTTGTP